MVSNKKNKDKTIDFSGLFKKTIDKFVKNLESVEELRDTIKDIEKTPLYISNELSKYERKIFDNDDNLKGVSIFDDKLNFDRVENHENSLKYLRLLHIYSVGAQHYKNGEKLLVKYKTKLNTVPKKENDIEEMILKNLPPKIGDLAMNIYKELKPEFKNVNLKNIDFSNPVASLMSSGVNIQHLSTNVLPKVKKYIKNMDEKEISKEITDILFKLKNM